MESEFIFHVEKEQPLKDREISFILLVRNMLSLRWRSDPQFGRHSHEPELQSRETLRFPYAEILGESPKLIHLLSTLDKIADTEIPVLIQGESGTGKELIANAIHRNSKRGKSAFISENCAAIPDTLLESELFGHTKGAFTGAVKNKEGLFAMADKGTLFLDEVGDMSLSMQKKLLRALQNGEIRPVGSNCNKKVNIRIVAATNKDLKQAIAKGEFREDLYYRLNVVHLVSPPLRERGNDILLLFEQFLEQKVRELGCSHLRVSDEVKRCLLAYRWPGNIRELQNELQRIVTLIDDEIITCDLLSPEIRKAGQI